MLRTFKILFVTISATALLLAACANPHPLAGFEEISPATVLEHPEPRESTPYAAELVSRGQYLVSMLRCGACHTDGALAGKPNGERLLAGSSVGIAFTNPLQDKHPGVVYPSNLTPDTETGLGGWSEQQVMALVRTGTNRHGGKAFSVMPYLAYATINNEDARAIATYLASLPPVRHEVPKNVSPGQRAPAPYVHFGVYMSKELVDRDQ